VLGWGRGVGEVVRMYGGVAGRGVVRGEKGEAWLEVGVEGWGRGGGWG